MNRSPWSKPNIKLQPPENLHKRTLHSGLRESRSELEKWKDERHALIFQWVEAAERRNKTITHRLLGLLLAASLFVTGLILAINGWMVRPTATTPGLHLLFALLAGLSALLLCLSLVSALGGWVLGEGAAASPGWLDPTNLRTSTREQLILAAIAKLQALGRAERLFQWALRAAAILLAIGLFPYLLVIVLLLI